MEAAPRGSLLSPSSLHLAPRLAPPPLHGIGAALQAARASPSSQASWRGLGAAGAAGLLASSASAGQRAARARQRGAARRAAAQQRRTVVADSPPRRREDASRSEGPAAAAGAPGSPSEKPQISQKWKDLWAKRATQVALLPTAPPSVAPRVATSAAPSAALTAAPTAAVFPPAAPPPEAMSRTRIRGPTDEEEEEEEVPSVWPKAAEGAAQESAGAASAAPPRAAPRAAPRPREAAASARMGAVASNATPTPTAEVVGVPEGVKIEGLGMVPPEEVRDRISHSRGMLGRHVLGYVGDAVWEFLVLKHQYGQAARSPWMESQVARTIKQAKISSFLFKGDTLKKRERDVLMWGTSNAWRKKFVTNTDAVEQVGLDVYGAARGLCTMLGFLHMDAYGSDDRIHAIAEQLGLLAGPREEDILLSEITGGIYKRPKDESTLFFGALQPLGNCVLRLYVSRYLCDRAPRDEEFIYRVKTALRPVELNAAAAGFLRDDAKAEEVQLMKAAQGDDEFFGFAFQCLLGHLTLTQPFRLHQIIAGFGWAKMLPGTF